MDVISFEKAEGSYYNGKYTAAKIIINGEDFKHLVESKYPAITYNLQFADWLYEQLMHPESRSDIIPDEVAILTCLCTIDGCGGFFCTVEEKDNTIVWRNFHSTGDIKAYEQIGDYRFETVAYKSEIERLKSFSAESS